MENLPKNTWDFLKTFYLTWLEKGLLIFSSIYLAAYVSLQPFLIKKLINIVSSDSQVHLFDIALPVLGEIFASSLLVVFAWVVRSFVMFKAIPRLKFSLYSNVFKKLQQQGIDYFSKFSSGTMVNSLKELEICLENFFEIFFEAFRGLLTFLIALFLMFQVHPYVLVIMLFWLVCFYAVAYLLYSRLQPIVEDFSQKRSTVFSSFLDSVSNYMSIKAFARESLEYSIFSKDLKMFCNIDQLLKNRQMKATFFLGLIFLSCNLSLIIILLQLKIQQLVTLGDFTFVLWSAISLLETSWYLVDRLSYVPYYTGLCENALKVFAAEPSIQDAMHSLDLKIFQGEIIFQDLCFKYENEKNFFQHLNVHIQPKTKVALVGLSGGGKTTFIRLLSRFYEPTEGSILIDGQNIQNVSQDSLRKNIVYIQQDPLLFQRSIMENIRFGNPEASDDEVIEAARKASAHDFITQLPLGYNTLVGVTSMSLSGGQKQRIILARAILKNAKIIVLDEATSALDVMTESAIQKAFLEFMKNKTCLIVTHRFSFIEQVDRILVFEKGNITQDGTHQQLLAQKGLYQVLWNRYRLEAHKRETFVHHSDVFLE